MATAADVNLGPVWTALQRRGWSIRPKAMALGTAMVDAGTRTIWIQPAAYRRPGLRHRRYVLPHEVYHALHAELGWLGDAELASRRRLTVTSAREAVADGGVLEDNPTRLMRSWVRASVIWHGRIPGGKYRYRWADVVAPETRALLTELRAAAAGL